MPSVVKEINSVNSVKSINEFPRDIFCHVVSQWMRRDHKGKRLAPIGKLSRGHRKFVSDRRRDDANQRGVVKIMVVGSNQVLTFELGMR